MTDENLAQEVGGYPTADANDPDIESELDPQDRDEELDPQLLKAELTALRDEFEGMRNQLMRTLADFQNFRKRKDAELQTLKSYAAEKLVLDLLPVLDNFHRTVEAARQGSSLESIKSGIEAVERQFLTALEANNVVPIASHGQTFDPEVHEAISHEETDEHPPETITQVLESGYKMADRVIRPARVRVSKKP